MRGPGETADLVLAPARIAAGLLFHFEQYEIAEAAFIQMPGGAQARHSAAHDHDRNFDLPLGRGERNAIAQAMTQGKRIVDETAGDGPVGLAPEPQQRRSPGQHRSAGYLAISFHSRS